MINNSHTVVPFSLLGSSGFLSQSMTWTQLANEPEDQI